MSIITDPDLWKDINNDTPPLWWEAVETDDRYWFYDNDPSPNPGSVATVTLLDAAELPETLTFEWEIVTVDPDADPLVFRYSVSGVHTDTVIGSAVGSGSITTTSLTGATSFAFSIRNTAGFPKDADRMYGNVVAIGAPVEPINYNCDCDDLSGYETLSQLRARLMVRLGYAGQVNNPPPGMAALLNDFLQSSQRLLYMKYTELRTERFFTWTMTAGTRLYDLPDNEDVCTKKLNALKLSWVGVEDLNGAWLPLISGIPPEFYTGITMQSIPERYEIRQCIEVFPVPDAAYKLRIKGHFKLQAFTADADQTTIDSELVFMWALATAKAHYGQPDANNIAAMANDYLGRLVGGKHGTKRYVPGATPIPAAVRPVMRDGFDA